MMDNKEFDKAFVEAFGQTPCRSMFIDNSDYMQASVQYEMRRNAIRSFCEQQIIKTSDGCAMACMAIQTKYANERRTIDADVAEECIVAIRNLKQG